MVKLLFKKQRHLLTKQGFSSKINMDRFLVGQPALCTVRASRKNNIAQMKRRIHMSDNTKDSASSRRTIWVICRIFLLVLLALFVLSCAVLILQSVLPIDRMPGLLRPSAENNSAMSPTVKRGDFLLLRSAKDGVKTGDVVSYKSGRGFTLGRVISEDGDEIIVKGDADCVAVKIAKESVRGIWNGFRIPLLGYPILWIQTVPGCIIFIVLFILLDVAISLLAGKKKQKDAENIENIESSEAEKNTKESEADDDEGFAIGGFLILRGWSRLKRRINERKARKGENAE